jgi:nitroreductase
MDFMELIEKRRSVRGYKPETVSRELIDRCIDAAGLAPSACNSQPWKFIAVDEPKLKNKIAAETFSKTVSINKFALQAPVIIAAVMEKANLSASLGGVMKNKKYSMMDVAIAVEHFCLMAAELGLGTCILGWFNEGKVKKLLNTPKSRRIPLLITLGYAKNEGLVRKVRKDPNEIRSYNGY